AIDALRRVKPPRQLNVDTWARDASVFVAVADNGEGVAPEIAPRLFRPFATTKSHRGPGLGLYISRQLAREAGGDVALVSPPGGGARFRSSLPRAPPPSAPVPVLAPDVILVDLRMPRMGGIELYARLEQERPDLVRRVLFLSGDVSQLAEPGNTPVPRERLLVKPVELAELERRIAAFVQELKASGG